MTIHSAQTEKYNYSITFSCLRTLLFVARLDQSHQVIDFRGI
jgi:hypothetical protein